jgi:hypothetical protein
VKAEQIYNKYPKEKLMVLQCKEDKTPCKIKCLECGKIYTFKHGVNAISPQRKVICKECEKRKKNNNNFIKEIKEQFAGEEFDIINLYKKDRPIDVKCRKCGKIYHYEFASTIKTKEYICNQCNNINNEHLHSSFGRLLNKEEWQVITQFDNYDNGNQLIECKCNNCGKISRHTLSEYLEGVKCPCSIKNKNQLKQYCGKNEYELLSIDDNFNKIKIKHNCGYWYNARVERFITGNQRCPMCRKLYLSAYKTVENYLIKNNIKYKTNIPIFIDERLIKVDFYLENNQKICLLPLERIEDESIIYISHQEIEQIRSILTSKVQRPVLLHVP